METSKQVTADDLTISDIISNKAGLYEGDLIPYFRAIFNNARNLNNPYHNFRHIFHVLWLCYDGCMYYSQDNSYKISRRKIRSLLIATMFHDFDHSGRTGQDDLEIARALRGLEKHIADEDRPYLDEIKEMIIGTEFPHRVPADKLSLGGRILRDADVSQALSNVWIQQILFGLGTEMGLTPMKVLEMQEGFLSNLHFNTEWAQTRFNPTVVQTKIAEAKALLSFLK